jgi:hypothetical protein
MSRRSAALPNRRRFSGVSGRHLPSWRDALDRLQYPCGQVSGRFFRRQVTEQIKQPADHGHSRTDPRGPGDVLAGVSFGAELQLEIQFNRLSIRFTQVHTLSPDSAAIPAVASQS